MWVMTRPEGRGPLFSPPLTSGFGLKLARSGPSRGALFWFSLLAIIAGTGLVTQARAGIPAVADPTTYLADVTSLLSKDWPSNRIVNIVCHGHSVVAGYFKTPEVRMLDAYPALLRQDLCQRFPHAVLNVTVTAIGGENAESGAKRFAREVLALRPDVVTIDYALNDRGIGLARAEAAWRLMIEAALAAQVKVILLTPTPDLQAKLDDPNDPLNQHAEQIRRLAVEYHVGLVDSLAQFKSHIHHGTHLVKFMAQSNHPNRKGHALVAGELLKWFPNPLSKSK
jgi:acyl-CoA thioesterase-1